MNLILFGLKGVGKTYLGERLAQEIGWNFIDTDRWIEQHYKLTCSEIYKVFGESHFREQEKAIVNSLKGISRTVIALGGGTLLQQENRETLKKMGLLIYLEAAKEILKERIFSRPLPAFFDPVAPEESFEKMVTERLSLYENIPAHKVSLDGRSERAVLDDIKRCWNGK